MPRLFKANCLLPAILIHTLAAEFLAGDCRSYVWTEEYPATGQGDVELEYGLEYQVQHWEHPSHEHGWEHGAEVILGVMDGLELAVRSAWSQSRSDTEDRCEYSNSHVHLAYGIGQAGELPVDIGLYGEYAAGNGSTTSDGFEGRLILSKDFGRWNATYNQLFGKEFRNGNATEQGYCAGVACQLSGCWKVAVESVGSYTASEYYAGPTLSWGTERISASLGLLTGLNHRSNDLQVQLIIGIPF